MLVERAAAAFVSPDVAVDRLVADREVPPAPQPAGDLLRTPVLAEERLHLRPRRGREPAVAPGARAPAPGIPVGELGAVGPVAVRSVAAHLAPDRAAVPAQQPGDRCGRRSPLAQQPQGISFGEGDLVIRHRWLPSLGGESKLPYPQVTFFVGTSVALTL